MSTSRRERLPLAAAGVVTGLAGLAASLLAAALLHLPGNPVTAVASVVRDLTPGPVAEALIGLVGHADKPLLIAGTTLVVLLVAGAAGVLQARSAPLAYALLGALGVIGFIATSSAPGTETGGGTGSGGSPAAAIPVVIGFVVWALVLPMLVGVAQRYVEVRAAPSASPAAVGHSRRVFLERSAIVVVGALVLGGASRALASGRDRVEAAREALRLRLGRGTTPSGADLGVAGQASWRTADSDFYLIHTALAVPQVAPDDWSLRIHGMVERELTISFAELARRERTEDWITLCCVSNEVGGPLIGNAYWSGVPIRSLLAEAGVKDGADAVKQTSEDGWTCGTPLAALTDPDRQAMLALGMNGEPLPIEHGFPVRMVVPGLYGYVSATKWLVDLEVTRFDDFAAYWTERGWGEKGPVKTESRIDVPVDGEAVDAGRVAVAGVAWAQHTGIDKVEVQLDGGSWQDARLGTVPGVDTWVQWVLDTELDAGEHTAVVRATDRSGYTQTAARADVLPDGATGWHSRTFTVQG
ncbi:oxidoreductase [Marmoricola endophyticus]|uniref:Oxidoreductase n=1 Tax=Marmoricola endophyticus TaxID=2040280 RepID=A0A917BQC0_9ACTN|nr:molybdopterin-dependent oxidoreductase [Marmoricola endophyticus]GGF52076.1 oxidoreductase [Marmoricola endophyticus]